MAFFSAPSLPPPPPAIRVSASEPAAVAQTAPSRMSRDASQAVAFCDRFNAGEGLPEVELTHKRLLMASSGLKLARCMPALFMFDVLGPYADLAVLSPRRAPVVWIDGDAHYGNFGVIVGNDSHPVWGLNDYDMACKGSPAMDLDRLAFSLVSGMTARGLDSDGISIVLARSYLDEVQRISQSGPTVGYLKAEETTGAIRKMIDKAADVRRDDWILQYATRGKEVKTWHLLLNDAVQVVDRPTADKICASLRQYEATLGPAAPIARPLEIMGVARPLQIIGVGRKVSSGGSSHGQPRYYALVQNAVATEPPVLLEIKQELPAPLVAWDGDAGRAVIASKGNWTGDVSRADAAQIVRAQHAMGLDNPLVGATRIDGLSYLVREREPCGASLTDKDLQTVQDYELLAAAAGRVLARAHARSADQARAILSWAGDAKPFSERLERFAHAYALQVEADCVAFKVEHKLQNTRGTVPDFDASDD